MIDDPATISTTTIQKASSWAEASMLEMIRTRSGSSHTTESPIATVVIAAAATTKMMVHDLPTPRAMNNRTTTATAIVQPSRTPNNAPLQETEVADEAAFPEEALASASATTTTYGEIAYRNDIESKLSTLSACSTPESLTSYEVENTTSDQGSVILNEIALINISQSASTTAQQQLVAAATAAAAFDAAAPYVENSSNNDNVSRVSNSNSNNSVATNKSNKSNHNNNDMIVQTVGCGNRTVTLIQSPVSTATARSIKSSTSSSTRKGSVSSVNSASSSRRSHHRGTQSINSSPVGGGGGEGSITRSIKSYTNRNQENVIIDEERDDNATTTAATTAALIISTTAEEQEQEQDQDQRQTNNNDYDDDEMSVELSIATQPTMPSSIGSPNNPSCAISPTSYTTTDYDNTSMAEDHTVITSQPLLVEQHASVAENNEVEVQFTKGGKKVKLSRKSKNILFNPFKSSSVSGSGGGGVKEKSTMTATAENKMTKKKELISNQAQQDHHVISSNNVSIKQPMQSLVDSVSFSSPTNVSTTISEDNIEVQACFGDDDDKSSSCHEQRGSSPTLMLVNTATLKEALLLQDVSSNGGHNEHIQHEVVTPAAMSSMERANSGSIHSHLVSSSNRPYSSVAKDAVDAAESESLHSMSTVTPAVVVTNSPSLPTHNKFTSPLIRGISLQKAKLFKRISSSTTAVLTNSERVDECTNSPKKAASPKVSSPKAKLLKSFGRFTKKSSSKRLTKVKSAPLVKLETVLESVPPETVLESVAPLPECQPELLQPNEVAKTLDDNLIIPEEEMPDSSTLEITTQEALRTTESIERKQSPPRDGLNMAESVELLASYDGSFSHSSIKSVAFVSVATDLEDNAPEQKTDHTDDVIATATTSSDDNIYQAQIPSKSISSDGPATVVDHELEAVHPMNDENESSHDIISYPLLIIQKTTSSTVNTSEQESDASGSGRKQTRLFMSKNMSKKAITSASARLSGYFNKIGKGKPLVESSTTSDKSPGSTFTDTQEAVSNSTDDAAGDTEPQINLDVSNGEVNDACKLATHTTPEGFVTKQENDDERNNQSDVPRKLTPDEDKSLEIPPMHAPEAKLYHALSEVKEKAQIAFTKREYASQKLVEKNTLEEELSSLLTTAMSNKGGDMENQEKRMIIMISKLQTKVDHARAEHAKAELASILAMAEATKARDDAKCALDGLSKKDRRKKNRKKVRIEEDGGDDEEDMSTIDFLDSVSTESTMDSGQYSEQAEKNWLLDSDFMRYICCNGRDDFTMADITDSSIGISHESSEIKESEYRIRDETSLLDLIVT